MDAWGRLKKIEGEFVDLHESNFQEVNLKKLLRMNIQLYKICQDQQTQLDNLTNKLRAKDIIF